ncbi:hypothetical protein [Planococcus beigongshangi]|uniref:hypothetical protein n=1 Tax=Planococcus beigongshangi TaxID=2782536 RepID=UPI00193C0400|nr:hypothetical protein [Planococcus beigongshangi]
MERNITASIVDMELREVTCKTRAKKQKFSTTLEYSYEIEGTNVRYDCAFDFKLTTTHIKAKYFYEVSINDIEEEDLEEFILEEEEEVFFPLLSKMSGLIMKFTDEINPFPFVTPVEFWEMKNLDFKEREEL